MKRLDVRSLVFPATLVAMFLTALQASKAQDVVWLLPTADWKYFQDGEPDFDNDFNEWWESGYDDSGWDVGAAELGFDTAANSETTLLTRGKITYYFRTTINVTQAQLDVANQLQLNLVRDDGAVIYINGEEIHRDNMPGNPGGFVSYSTLAEKAVAGSDESRTFTSTHLSSNFLTVGENVIAVEVHQNSAGSSDISFSLGMDGYNFIPILGDWTPPAPITFENSGVNAESYSYILNENDPFELGWELNSTGGDRTAIHFVHPDLQQPDPGGFTDFLGLVTSGGSANLVTDVAGTDHFDRDYPGAYRVNLSNYKDVAVQFGLRAYDHTGAGMGTSSRAQAWIETSSTGDTFTSDQVLDLSGGASSELTDTLVADSAARRVLVPTSNIGTTWRNVGFNDTTWQSGSKGAGYDTATTYNPYLGSTLDLESQLRNRNGSLYMRIPFNVADKSAYTSLLLCMRFDDGFVAYINGQQVSSKNAPSSLAYNSEASTTNADTKAVAWEVFDISSHLSALNDGANVLAIHGLNKGTGSSDMLIAPELKAIKIGGGGGTNPGAPEILDDIAGDLDGPFTVFRYDVADTAQTVRLRFQMNCNTGQNALILDNILISGTPLTVQTYADWIALNTDFDPDDEGHPSADPDGDTVKNLLEYAFGGLPHEANVGLTPTSSVIEIFGDRYFALTWRQRNLSFSGGLGTGEGGLTVGDITYIPEFSTDGIIWEGNSGQGGDEVAFLVSGLEEDSIGEYVEVTAAFEDPISDSPETLRLFGRIRIELDAQ